uniref:(northern house mosquito) hypothetical protein n=1 Tax=Culex pipiens TaxID=7175 RepID=A0A8D8E4Q7_CULPI
MSSYARRAVKLFDSWTPNKTNAYSTPFTSTENLFDVVVPVVVHFRLGQRAVPVWLVRLVVFNVGELVVVFGGVVVVVLLVGALFGVVFALVLVIVLLFFAGGWFHVGSGSCHWCWCCC